MAMSKPHAGQEQALREQLEPVVRALGLVLDDVVVSAAGMRRLLRVVIDLPDDQTTPVSMDAVADAAREVDAALDAADPMGQSPYTLEVTSPGVERPLTQPRHLRRNIGRTIALNLADGATVTGRLLSMGDDDALELLLPGAKKGMPATKKRTVAVADVVSGVVQVEFTHALGTQPYDPGVVDDDDDEDDEDWTDVEDDDTDATDDTDDTDDTQGRTDDPHGPRS